MMGLFMVHGVRLGQTMIHRMRSLILTRSHADSNPWIELSDHFSGEVNSGWNSRDVSA